MKHASQFTSRFTWLLLVCIAWTGWYILLRPTWLEFGIVFVVDTLALIVFLPIYAWLFGKLYPRTFQYLFKDDISAIESLKGTADRCDFLAELVKFPRRQAASVASISFPKVVAPVLVMIFYWQHSTSNWQQFFIILICFSIFMLYTYATVYIENQIFISKTIEDIHLKYNWEEVFKTFSVDKNLKPIHTHEITAVVFLWIFMVTLQVIILNNIRAETHQTSIINIVFVGVMGLLLISRIIYLSRTFVMNDLLRIFKNFEELAPDSSLPTIAISSEPVLARFAQTFNRLIESLKKYEIELANWVFTKAEQTRYESLGEMSALIAHDLSSPLHVISFCTNKLQTLKGTPPTQIIEVLKLNTDRMIDLIDSMKNALKHKEAAGTGEQESEFQKAYNYSMRLIATKYFHEGFSKVDITVDHDISDYYLKISHPDLIHILSNIYTNSINNLIDNDISKPRIHTAVERSKDRISITISDNGTGLDVRRFANLTDFAKQNRVGIKRETGLGLRLINRLAEIHDGKLELVHPLLGTGTSIRITIPGYIKPKEPTSFDKPFNVAFIGHMHDASLT